ncbi:MAG TPA: GNAT family N-acetyltransferase [Phycisphaerales bacterium]|nr:GNAT family N-acetyltransferase [Phycisphaerales bacterium]
MSRTGWSYGGIAGQSEIDACAFILGTAFGSPPAQSREWIEKSGSDDMRAGRADGELVACLRFVRMAQWWGSKSVPMVGVAGVGVAPHRRGEGFALELMRSAMRELAAEGCPISCLYPATQRLYDRAGYAQAGSRFHVTVPLPRLNARAGKLKGMTLRDEDAGEVKACYTRAASHLNGYLDRGDYCWTRVRESRDGPVHGFGFRDTTGIRGYLYYTQSRKSTGKHDLKLTDIAADSRDAAMELLAFLSDHRSMGDDAVWHAGPHDPLLALIDEQVYTLTLHHYWMMRITDARRALEARGYASAVRADLHLDIADDLLDLNRGRFVLTAEGGTASVKPGGRGDLRLDIRTLATLYSGLRSAYELRALGLIECTDGGAINRALADASAIFAGPAPATPDMY